MRLSSKSTVSTLYERNAPRLREVLAFLAGQDSGSAHRDEILDYVEQRFPPEAVDTEPVSGGMPKWKNGLLWSTTGLVKAGWLTKDGYGTWTVTTTGRDAVATYEDPVGFRAEVTHRYNAWLQANKSKRRRAWLVRGSSVRGVSIVDEWLKDGWVSLQASQLRQIEQGISAEDLEAAAKEDYDHLKHQELRSKVDEIVNFVNKMAIGDIVLTSSDELVFVGDVTGDWSWLQSEDGRSNLRRNVEWRNADAPIEFNELPAPLPAKLAAGAAIVDLTTELDLIDGLTEASGGNGEGPGSPLVAHEHLAAPSSGLADQLLVDDKWLSHICELLDERKQIIFYGPPGTGKTFLAQRIAADLVGPEQVKLVQFHPAFTYEDFFEGFRPESGDGSTIGFELKPGPLRQLVSRAIEHREQAFILIIDEINRANLAKVFGELYFLLEYRDQAVELLYSGGDDPFTLPNNIYFIGTMNTADRSIALVDSAMRRRFAFVGLDPSQEPTRSLLRRWSDRYGLPGVAADLVDELNRRIDDPDFQVGPSYFMKRTSEDAFSTARLELIWDADILPLLQEHYYGQWPAVSDRFALKSLLRSVHSIDGTEETPTETPQPELSPHDGDSDDEADASAP